MMCWKDMTFCNSDCTNTECVRFFGPEQQKQANEWMQDAPVSFANFSEGCEEYTPCLK